MNTSKIIIGGIAVAAILAVLSISGCTQMTTIEHRQDTTQHDAAKNIDLTVSTFNGNIEVQRSTDYKVEVIYNISASRGHLSDVVTGTDASRDGDTLKLKAEAKLSDPTRQMIYNHGADIVVKVPANSTYTLTLTTSNGNIDVPQLNGNKLSIDTSNGNIDVSAGNYSAIDAATSNGNIGVRLPNVTQFSLDAATSNGHIGHGAIAMQSDHETQTSFVGRTASGNGNMHIVLRTSNGNIDVTYA